MEEEVKVSELPIATNVNDDDLVMVVQDGFNKKISKKLLFQETQSKIENIQLFSTNEVEIGKWVNGKTLYRKVFGGTVSNIASKCNADAKTFILNMYGYAVASNGVYMPMNNSFSNSGYVWSAWWASNMDVAVNFGSNFANDSAVIIVMEYTKD